MGHRTCTKCGESKPEDEFPVRSNRPSRESRCRACKSAYARQYYLANRAKVIARTGAHQRANPERYRAYYRKYNEANRESRRDYSRKYRAEDPDRIKAQQRSYRKRNPDKHRRDAQARRAALAKVEHDPAVTIGSLRLRDGEYCCYCGIAMTFCCPDQYEPTRATLEHITPVSKGGPHVFANTALCCRTCNLSKRNSTFLWKWVTRSF